MPDARLLPVIGYEEMLELAHQGAQVMQTRAVELGWVNGVVIAVRSTFSDHPGTLHPGGEPTWSCATRSAAWRSTARSPR